MPAAELSLADHVCLAVIAEGRTHGWAIVQQLRPEGELGRIWSLSRPLTYRSIDRLAELELIARNEQGRRTALTITHPGSREFQRWIDRPVDHLRDLRTEFLLKLTLRSRRGLPSSALVGAQRVRLEPTIDSLLEATDSDPIDVWRRESALAARRFLDRLEEQAS